MKSPVGKRRTREHVIADLSINFVERHALLSGYTLERIRYDYGIDLELKTYNAAGEREPGDVLLQVKATDTLSVRERQTTFSFRIERANLVLWLSELEPVILIVFDARKTRAYWLCIQQYFAALTDFNLFAAGKTITLRVPFANRVDSRAMRRFAKLRDEFREQSRSSTDD